MNEGLKILAEIIAPLAGLAVVVFATIRGAVELVKKIKQNKKLKLNKEDGYYYDKKGGNPFCPNCYETKRLKAQIINDKCAECGKVYKYPPIVIAVCHKPKITRIR